MDQTRSFTEEEYKFAEAEKFGAESKTVSNGAPIDDKWVRRIGIPFFGLAIPSVTGLVELHGVPALFVMASYLYFILIAGLIWEGNRYLLFRYYPEIFQSRSAIRKYALMTGVNIFYTVPVAAVLLYSWKWLANGTNIEPRAIWITTAVIVVFVIFISNMYEKVLLMKYVHRENQRKLAVEKINADAIRKGVEGRLIVRKGMDYCPLQTMDIAYIFTENKISFVIDKKGQLYMAGQSLAELEMQLSQKWFFRVNRQFIVNIEAISKFRATESGRVKLELSPAPKTDVIIGKEKATEFRAWLRGGGSDYEA